MKALVVGGAGFIGCHLSETLLKLGHQVVCVDNLSLGKMENIKGLLEENAFSFFQADASNKKELADIFVGERIEYVFHLAANSDIQASAANPDIELKNTYQTTFCILSCMREYQVKKLFFASTSAVYGDKAGEALCENTPELAPVSYYGAAKLGCEALIHAFSYMNDFSSLVFRFPNVIGPKLTHGVVFDFIKKLQKNPEVLEILGDGKQTKPYLYVADLVRAITMLMHTADPGMAVYNVGVESSTSVKRIADLVCEEMGLLGVRYEYTGGSGGWKGDVPKFQYCLDKIRKTDWHPQYESDEAVRMAIRAVLNPS